VKKVKYFDIDTKTIRDYSIIKNNK